jgi:hypothetical protein
MDEILILSNRIQNKSWIEMKQTEKWTMKHPNSQDKSYINPITLSWFVAIVWFAVNSNADQITYGREWKRPHCSHLGILVPYLVYQKSKTRHLIAYLQYLPALFQSFQFLSIPYATALEGKWGIRVQKVHQ